MINARGIERVDARWVTHDGIHHAIPLRDYADEAFCMLDGEIEFQAGGIRAVATKCMLVFLPRGTVHTVKVRSQRARMLKLYTQPSYETIHWADRPTRYRKDLPT